VGFLEIARSDFGRGDMGRDRHHRHPAAMGIEQAVDEVQVARPARPRADRPPVVSASPAAAKAATSSWRTCSHSISPCGRRRMASVKPFRLSPTMPQMRRTPAAWRVSTIWSATVGMTSPLPIAGSACFSGLGRDQAAGGRAVRQVWPMPGLNMLHGSSAS
jgi:hypothetical protein